MVKKVQKKITETDLSQPVREYFEGLGYTVHCEVKSCDMTATKEDELIIIELKLNFNMQLLYQATQRQPIADKVYVAIPCPEKGKWAPNWGKMCQLLKRLELGFMIVHFAGTNAVAEVILDTEPYEMRRKLRSRKTLVKEIKGRNIDHNQGGSVKRKIMTAYRDNAVHIACCLEKYGTLSPKRLIELGTGEKTPSILSKNVYGWFEWVERGIYSLRAEGKAGLEEYSALAEIYRKLLE